MLDAPVPSLETPRFRLRAHRLADFEACKQLWTDPAVTRFIGGRAGTPEEIWARIMRYAGQWTLLGYSYFAVEERGTGRFAGEAGLADFHRDLTPPFGDAPEVGWAFASAFHGQGVATEVVAAVMRWSDAQAIGRTVCMIDPGNLASLRVAEKSGFRAYAQTDYRGHPMILLERRAPA
jgi:RimJ/RimL family protein N-acetyltransferase